MSYETRFESSFESENFEVGSGLSDENFIQMLISHYKVEELTLSIPSEKFKFHEIIWPGGFSWVWSDRSSKSLHEAWWFCMIPSRALHNKHVELYFPWITAIPLMVKARAYLLGPTSHQWGAATTFHTLWLVRSHLLFEWSVPLVLIP